MGQQVVSAFGTRKCLPSSCQKGYSIIARTIFGQVRFQEGSNYAATRAEEWLVRIESELQQTFFQNKEQQQYRVREGK